MTPIPLSSLVEKIGQEQAAKSLGSSQTAISKALKNDRLIFVTEEPDGSFTAIELKGFPTSGPNIKALPDLDRIVDQLSRLGQGINMAGNPSSTSEARP